MRKDQPISKINQTPRGLQNFLGNINQGVNPSQLDQAVAPTVDLHPFWAVDKVAIKSKLEITSGAAGSTAILTVPEGEIWDVIAAGAIISYPANHRLNASIRINNPEWASAGTDEGACVIFNIRTGISVALAGQDTVGGMIPTRLLLPAGWSIQARLDAVQTVVAGTDVNLSVLYNRIKD